MAKKAGKRSEMLSIILRDQNEQQITARHMMDAIESLSTDNIDIHNRLDHINQQIEEFRDNIALIKQGIDVRIEEKIEEMNTPEFVPSRFESDPEPEPETSVFISRLSPLLESPDESAQLKSKKKTKKKRNKSKKRKSKKRKSKK